jgi:hypothetical protein
LGISIGTPSKKSDNHFHYNWNNEWYIVDENGNKSQSFSDENMREK